MSEDKYNPFSADTIDKMLDKKKMEEQRKALLEEEIAEWKACIERIFSSPDGKFLAKKIIKYSGVFSFDSERLDGSKIAEAAIKRKFWLELFRPYLNKVTRTELENQ